MGTVQLDFKFSGNIPFSRLRLKMCAKGQLISQASNLINVRLMPSMSGLALISKDLIISSK